MKRFFMLFIMLSLVLVTLTGISECPITNAKSLKPQDQVKNFMNAAVGLKATEAASLWVSSERDNVTSEITNLFSNTKISISKLKLKVSNQTTDTAEIIANYSVKIKRGMSKTQLSNQSDIFTLSMVEGTWLIFQSTLLNHLSELVTTSTPMTLSELVTASTLKSTIVPNATETEGALPVMKIGDKWVLKEVMQGTEYTITYTVTGEDVTDGKDCYVMEVSFDPLYTGIYSSGIDKMDKKTLKRVKTQISGTYHNLPCVVTYSYSYQIAGDSLYPLEVGKEHKVVENETTTLVWNGKTKTKTVIKNYTCKMEKIEQLTVPAGTFKAFKLVYCYDGKFYKTTWVSDDTKCFSLETIDNKTGAVSELISYSVSR